MFIPLFNLAFKFRVKHIPDPFFKQSMPAFPLNFIGNFGKYIWHHSTQHILYPA